MYIAHPSTITLIIKYISSSLTIEGSLTMLLVGLHQRWPWNARRCWRNMVDQQRPDGEEKDVKAEEQAWILVLSKTLVAYTGTAFEYNLSCIKVSDRTDCSECTGYSFGQHLLLEKYDLAGSSYFKPVSLIIPLQSALGVQSHLI